MSIAAKEIVQIVDSENNPIGAEPRALMRQKGLPHRATYILVYNSWGELFIQKRTTTKDIFPGYWDIAAGGVVLAGESYDVSAQRELAEELGIQDVPLEFLFTRYYENGHNKVWGSVYRCKYDGPFILQKEEVEYGMFLSPDKIVKKAESELFTPDSLEILHRVSTC